MVVVTTKAFTPKRLAWIRGQLELVERHLKTPSVDYPPPPKSLVLAVNALRLVVTELVDLADQEVVE